MASPARGQTTTTTINPDFKPYIQFGLGEGKRLYEGYEPPPETLAVGPSSATQQALGMAEQRAMAGSPLVKAAQEEQLATIQGRGLNPYLASAAESLYRPTVMAGQSAIEGLKSKASSMGRYGSDAMAQVGERTGYNVGLGLGDVYKQLAYNSSEAERARQVAASQLAPTLGAADYADIQRLLQVGQGREAYDLNAIQGKLAAQDLPMQRLQKTSQVFYGAPLETTSVATPTGGK